MVIMTSTQKPTFLFTPMESGQVITAMRKFKTSQGQYLDEISSFFLKAGMPVLAEPLAELFNPSLSTGFFPDLWKTARIVPIHKADATVERSTYRPISVLPVLSWLFEKLVFDQLYNYFISNEMLFSRQSSFRKLHSVLTFLLKCTNVWYLNIDSGQYTLVTFIELKKAFDAVNRDILLKKLELYGARSKELGWFPSYLSNGMQCCKVNGKLSKFERNAVGVPQGSCLGPLLFILYINYLPLSLKHSQVNMYADDTSISFSANSINERVNEDLDSLRTSASYGSEAISCDG